MKTSIPAQSTINNLWCCPLNTELYDRSYSLSVEERDELDNWVHRSQLGKGYHGWTSHTYEALHRLFRPLKDVIEVAGIESKNSYTGTLSVFIKDMHHRDTSFWAWTQQEWIESIGIEPNEFRKRGNTEHTSRQCMVVISYLLCDFQQFHVIKGLSWYSLAGKAFGQPLIDTAIKCIVDELKKLDYSPTRVKAYRSAICRLLLVNRSPYPGDLSKARLETISQQFVNRFKQNPFIQISHALVSLGIFDSPLRSNSSLQIRKQARTQNTADTPWCWPLNIESYDRNPCLSSDEWEEIDNWISYSKSGKGHHGWNPQTYKILHRLFQPLNDVIDFVGGKAKIKRHSSVGLFLWEMYRRGTSFWAWKREEWIEIIGVDVAAYRQHHHQALTDVNHRQFLFAVSYLLCNLSDIYIFRELSWSLLATKIFQPGRAVIALNQVSNSLKQLGYVGETLQLRSVINKVLLANRSPCLEDLTYEKLDAVRKQSSQVASNDNFVGLSQGLVGLGILSKPLTKLRIQGKFLGSNGALENISVEWLHWCQRWYDTSTYPPKTRRGIFYSLLVPGRWLAKQHPNIVTPEQWTRELAAEYVAMVNRMVIGEFSQKSNSAFAKRIGEPLSARSKDSYLYGIRTFFRDCQEWEWILNRFNPLRALATPRAVSALVKPNPRIIMNDVWGKLLSAGLNLTIQDLHKTVPGKKESSGYYKYPLEMVHAITLVWLFCGLRSDEIYRLQLGCIRWQENEVSILQTNDTVPKSAICYLQIPVNKTGSAFSKPIDRIVGEAIVAWEQIRPNQPTVIDKKTGEKVHYLFSCRGERVGGAYLNKTIIPMLTSKAGVPGQDARGKITSHRARSTIASQLYNAKDPMTLDELREWLGHRSVSSTLSYTKISSTKLAKSYIDADYFKQNLRTIEVLIDQDVIKSGAATDGEPWKFYDLGHGYCSYDFFDQCPHRMACAKCSFYVPKNSSKAQMLESKVNLQHMLQTIPLTEDERAAVEDGLEAIQKLCDKLADLPTPTGLTPKQIES